MKKEKLPGNFHPQIHDLGYRERLRAQMIAPSSLINDTGRPRESLDGLWQFAPDPYDRCLRAQWYKEKTHDEDGRRLPWDYDYDYWETVSVPGCWNMVRERYFLYEGPAVYTRCFEFDAVAGERVFLRFGAVYHDVMVFLNKEFLGCHEGGDTPFNIEVTGKLAKENRILCVVNNARRPDRIPTDVTDWFNYGGIYRSVDLLRLPGSFIRDYFIQLVPGSGYKLIRASVEIDTAGDAAEPSEAAVVIPELGIEEKIPLSGGKGELVFSASPQLWSPESPKLYNVVIKAGDDSVSEKIGFREISVSGTNILLNGKPVYLNGVSCHEESVKNGKALTEEEVRENFALVKELGGNYIRLAHYPHHERSARIADEAGLMIWAEVPVYWSVDFTNPTTIKNGHAQLEELIRRDRNRASVIIWSVGNENPDTDDRLAFMGGLAKKARELDPTRLVSAACLLDNVHYKIADRLTEYLDVIGLNEYFGWYMPDFNRLEHSFANSNPDKPVIISEFGGGCLAGHHGTKYEMFTEENQEFIYKRQTEVFRKFDFIKGTTPWILYDFRVVLRLNRFQKGYNRKGLLNEDKTKKKPGFRIMREFYKDRKPN